MQLWRVGIGVAEFRDLLAAHHLLAFLHHDLAVMRVHAVEAVVVLDDDELAVAADARSGVHHAPLRCCDHRIADPAADVDALAVRLGKCSEDLSLRRPDEVDRIGIAIGGLRRFRSRRHRDRLRSGSCRRRGFGLRKHREVLLRVRHPQRLGRGLHPAVALALLRDRRRLERARLDRTRTARGADLDLRRFLRRDDAQRLPDADLCRILQLVPLRQVPVVHAVLERDAVERVAAPDRVVAGRDRGRTRNRRRLRNRRLGRRRGGRPPIVDRRRSALRRAGRSEQQPGQYDCVPHHAFPLWSGTKRTGSSAVSL